MAEIVNLTELLNGQDKPTIEDIASTLFTNDNGINYIDALAVGANPTAKIYRDGTVIGSTDNGEYIRFANGELMCFLNYSISFTITTAKGSLFTTSSVTGSNFPIIANVVKFANIFIEDNFNNWSSSGGSVTSTSKYGDFRCLSTVSETVTLTIRGFMTGRWKA